MGAEASPDFRLKAGLRRAPCGSDIGSHTAGAT